MHKLIHAKKWWPVLLLYLVYLATAAGCGNQIEPGNTAGKKGPAIKVRVDEAKEALNPIYYEAVGSVEAVVATTISSKLLGTVSQVAMDEGEYVKKGDVLVVLKAEQAKASLRQAQATVDEARKAQAAAKASLESSQIELERATADYRRYKKLLADGVIAQQAFERIEAAHQQAKAMMSQMKASFQAAQSRVKQTQAAAANAGVTISESRLTAPYDGRITTKMVEVGDLAAPGKPLLTLEKTDRYRVNIIFPETLGRDISVGANVAVSLPALGPERLASQIDTILPTTDRLSRSFQARAQLPLVKGLRSGMFARVSIEVGKEYVLVVPKTAIVNQGQLTGLFVVDDHQRARFRLVRIGKTFTHTMEVITGLKNGERYVTAPPVTLVNGAKIESPS